MCKKQQQQNPNLLQNITFSVILCRIVREGLRYQEEKRMASSDDEDERLTPVVSDYSFSYGNDEPISFSKLRMLWDEADSLGGSVEKIDMYGTTDNGLQKIFEQVIAWKFDLSFVKPEIFVLSQKKKWLKLVKPRKSFEEKIRTILITVQFLHFLKRNPDATGKALWEYLSKSFSHYEPRPSEHDLADHLNLISEAVKRDGVLAKSQALIRILEDKPKMKKVLDEENGSKSISAFIDDAVIEEDGDGSDNEQADFYDHVCAICDNGGDILPCEGKCLRSFHATETAGAESGCESLGLSEEQVKAIGTFECKNCQYKQHQCYCCGKLGSSDKLTGAQVFQCVAGTCGYFYHPNCVAEALKFKFGDKSKDREAEIAAGNTFMCPLHFCYVCKEIEPEIVTDLQMQFAVCRRCPKAYHRKCLPRDIAFDEEGKDIVVRAWEDLMPNKILIYCLKHEIDDELETPVRDHIVFPDTDQKKKKHIPESVPAVRTSVKKRPYSPEGSKKTSVAKPFKDDGKPSVSNKDNACSREGKLFVPDTLRKPKLSNKSKVVVKKKFSGVEHDDADNSSAIGAKLYELVRPSMSNSLEKRGNFISKEQTRRDKPVIKEKDASIILDDDSKKRIDSIIGETETIIGLDDIKREHTAPSTHVYSARYVPQHITLGKIEGLIEAIKAALQKLERGGSLEDAKALCKPALLTEIVRWKSKLKVYLSPFLYGMRYTSFGRHFTKVDKLQAIVDKLHCYVKEGDMVVDFCCGANDFSCIMRKKLDEVGKNCSYKNFDILQAKNDFNFEKKDWMTVQKRDLLDGKNLIIGLNPPFGVNASLANKFIDKALEFRPKLLILIVPPETERLDKKRQPYDLVWEDHDLLSGKAFYLPGSIDSSDKRLEDWNLTAPPLSLWSRPDWTSKHNAIAEKNGHLSREVEPCHDKDAADFIITQARELSSILAGGDNATNVTNTGTETSQNNELRNDGDKKRKRGPAAEEKPSEERSTPRNISLNKSGDRSASSSLGKTPAKQSDNDLHAEEGHGKEKGSNGGDKKRRNGGGLEEKSSGERRSLPQHSSPTMSGGIPASSYIPKPRNHSHNEVHADNHHQLTDHEIRSRYSTYEGVANARMNNYSDEQFTRYQVEDQSYHSYDNSYLGRPNEAYRTDIDLTPAPLYGRRDPDPLLHRDHYAPPANPGFASSYGGHFRPTVESSYGRPTVESSYGRPAVNSGYSSTLQRYAPRLDELNPRRINNGAISDYPMSSGGLTYNPTPHAGVPNDSLGFAPAPSHTYSRHSSAGWLDD